MFEALELLARADRLGGIELVERAAGVPHGEQRPVAVQRLQPRDPARRLLGRAGVQLIDVPSVQGRQRIGEEVDLAGRATNPPQVAVRIRQREPDVAAAVDEHPEGMPEVFADLAEIGLGTGHGVDAIDVRDIGRPLTGHVDIQVVARRIDADPGIGGVVRVHDAVVAERTGRQFVADDVRAAPLLVRARPLARKMRGHVEPAVGFDDVAVQLALGVGLRVLAGDDRDVVSQQRDLIGPRVELEERGAMMRRVRRAAEVHVPVRRVANPLPLTVQDPFVAVQRERLHDCRRAGMRRRAAGLRRADARPSGARPPPPVPAGRAEHVDRPTGPQNLHPGAARRRRAVAENDGAVHRPHATERIDDLRRRWHRCAIGGRDRRRRDARLGRTDVGPAEPVPPPPGGAIGTQHVDGPAKPEKLQSRSAGRRRAVA